ncbi:hypothetical protein OsJ_15489 [Oryza sativa Japonica Group]|uniref:Uncharacterized protein n=1 Tax=Oryza sativa subsp. japonica TaxID=39947 RepID=A3AVM4_ORYSJ|nr:hypothetical protein OsJ_15489 [Oryza sativa Japonica Group]
MAKDIEAAAAAEGGEYMAKDYSDPQQAPLIDAEELTKWSLYRAVIAEFVATLLFLYITCHGHRVSLVRAVLYIVAQSLGAICGVGLVKGFQSAFYVRYGGGANELSDGYSKGTGLAAEIIGTFVLVYTVFSATDPKRNARDSHVPSDPGANAADAACSGLGISGIAWAFGGMIFILVYCTAGVSGGHINPAVTFGLFLARKVSLVRAVLYIVAQSLGAICGVGLVKGFQSAFYVRYGGGANELSDGYSKGTGLAAEIIGTFVLVYTVFSATDPKRNARDSHVPWIFWVGPLIGAAIAAAYHQYVLRASAAKLGSSSSFRG